MGTQSSLPHPSPLNGEGGRSRIWDGRAIALQRCCGWGGRGGWGWMRPLGFSPAACTSCTAALDPGNGRCQMRPLAAGVRGFGTENLSGAQPYATCPPAAPAPSRAQQMPDPCRGHCAPFSRASHLPVHPCQTSLPHKCQALSSTLQPENHHWGAHTAQCSPRMNNRDPLTKCPHSLIVSLGPLATTETAATGPGLGPAQLQGSFLPAAHPWDRWDSHPPGCCRRRGTPSPWVPTPRCHSILGTAPQSSL